MASQNSKLFTNHWTATLPSQPHIILRHATPSSISTRLAIIRNPLNRTHITSQPTLWDDSAAATWTTAQQARFDKSTRDFDNLDVLVEVDGVVVGVSAIATIEGDLKDGERLLNVGVMLEEVVRGKGVGKAVTGCLVEIALMMGGRVGVRTMKANVGMRGVMRGLGVEERVEDVMMEGRGLVAEIMYMVEKEKWEELDICLEFGEEV
ncbi:hypothetical protein V499_08615 [Pseudogymnoascus sp. VKM F-103]|uniref:N-acetyltransferase domain-containing protein n=1 Tax=Pseudogymnoascus verrucosus TaxID=342668 RepID=A0A1B8GRG6_9PEZI|nr:uncharacterized protein VE01_03101 [Pseudogymnoascus verrucosus]KFY71169.1 hypothetical protein V499_08615 [Pseudogymnoascus sp. VKM F-103]OBT98425.1 hypothetical protein VE01_03101 [Pseudogymnoascus verrucosus]